MPRLRHVLVIALLLGVPFVVATIAQGAGRDTAAPAGGEDARREEPRREGRATE